MQIDITVIIGVVGGLCTAIVALYKQNKDQQTQITGLLTETKELMGSLAELIRTNTTLMVEVKEVLNDVKALGTGGND